MYGSIGDLYDTELYDKGSCKSGKVILLHDHWNAKESSINATYAVVWPRDASQINIGLVRGTVTSNSWLTIYTALSHVEYACSAQRVHLVCNIQTSSIGDQFLNNIQVTSFSS